MDRVKITKRDFSRDRLLHDGSLFNDHLRIGMTHMTGNDKKQLDLKLYQYCRYKFEQLDVDIWVGISDAGLNPAKYDFTGIFFMSKKKPEML
ncbi:hypothetical protein AB9T89_12910 [Flavobacterium oncorhynchi]|uniref:hypothetical protein n=1 Tax=Flavobacterium oncorhynchi TaxID=728056 RepID=UPI003519FDE6